MKIIDQYVHETGRRLPAKGREETERELRSLLLDELEQRFGPDATQEQAKSLLSEHGSPAEMARRYGGEAQVIAPQLTDLYFLILRIIFLAMLIAFTTVFVVEAATGAIAEDTLWSAFLRVPMRTLSAFLSGTGALTLVFMGITRAVWSAGERLDSAWTPDELKDVVVGPQSESRFSRVFSIIMGVAVIVLLNVYPEIVTLAEGAFLRSGLPLGHRLVIDLFRVYVIVLSFIIGIEVVHHGVALRAGDQKPGKRLARAGITLATVVLNAVMLSDLRLYADYTGMVGFRLIVLISLGGHLIGLVTELVAYGKARLAARAAV